MKFRAALENEVEGAEVAWQLQGPMAQEFQGDEITVTFTEPGMYKLVASVRTPAGEEYRAEHLIEVKTASPGESATEGPAVFKVVLIKAELVENNGVGSDWKLMFQVDGDSGTIEPGSLPKLLYAGTEKDVTLRIEAVEEDEGEPDRGETPLELTVPWKEKYDLELVVYEDGKKESGKFARWLFVIEVSPEETSGQNPPPAEPPVQTPSSQAPGAQASEGTSAAPSETAGIRAVWAALQPLPPRGFTLIGAGDLDGDGRADLAAAAPGSTSIALFKGGGDGSFSEKGSLNTRLRPEKLIVADFNGDAFGDIVSVNWTRQRAELILCLDGFSTSSSMLLGVPPGAWEVFAQQLNANPGAELIWLTRRGPVVWSFLPKGGVLEWKQAPQGLSFVMPLHSPFVLADFDADGSLETAYYSDNPGDILLEEPDCEITLATTPGGVSLSQLAMADIDGDGIVDLLGLDQLGRVHTWRLYRP